MDFLVGPIEFLVSPAAFVASNIVPLAIITTAVVTSYKFLYKRPELIMEVEQSYSTPINADEDGDVEVGLMFLLANVGNNSASEVQLTITADAFKFDDGIEPTESITRDYEPKQAVMEIRSGRKSGFIGGGHRHDIYLENVVYENDVQELWLGPAIFTERGDGKNDLRYRVCCKEHRPRIGRISFDMEEDDEVRITGREYPTRRRRVKTWLYGRVERGRTDELENLDADDVEFQVEVN